MGPHSLLEAITTTCQVFNINAFPVGVNGVKPDFKAVSARLDAQEETRSEPQRVSHLCVCVNAA